MILNSTRNRLPFGITSFHCLKLRRVNLTQPNLLPTNARCLNSQALAAAAVKLPISNLCPSFSATALLSQTRQAVLRFTAATCRPHRTASARTDAGRYGQTASLKTPLNLQWGSVSQATSWLFMPVKLRKRQKAKASPQL